MKVALRASNDCKNVARSVSGPRCARVLNHFQIAMAIRKSVFFQWYDANPHRQDCWLGSLLLAVERQVFHEAPRPYAADHLVQRYVLSACL